MITELPVAIRTLHVGQALLNESRDLLENAAVKLQSKKLDLIAANDISAANAGFASETNQVTLLFADGRREALPMMSKTEVAEVIMGRVADLLE